jgi:hypothetical protein
MKIRFYWLFQDDNNWIDWKDVILMVINDPQLKYASENKVLLKEMINWRTFQIINLGIHCISFYFNENEKRHRYIWISFIKLIW